MDVLDRTQDVIDQKSLEFAERLLNLLRQKKEIDVSIKELKSDYKMEGVEVAKVNSGINRMKKRAKQTDIARAQDEQIETLLEGSDSIKLGIANLIE